MCQCVEYAQRVERERVGVKWEVMNCDGWGKLWWVGELGAALERGVSFVDDIQKGNGKGKNNSRSLKNNSRSLRDEKQKERVEAG
jgi:hypothetical protein